MSPAGGGAIARAEDAAVLHPAVPPGAGRLPLRWAEGPEARVMCSSLAGVGTWGTGTLCSSVLGWEGKHPLELPSKGMSAGPKLPGLHPGAVNRSASTQAAQNRLFIMKHYSATRSRDDLPGEQEVIFCPIP